MPSTGSNDREHAARGRAILTGVKLARLNPFAGLPNPREVWAWGMYDLANQSFTLLINTLLFAVYFKEVVVADPARGDALWGRIYAISMLLVVLSSPLLGVLADCRGSRKATLLWTGVGCAALTASFGLIPPGAVVLAVALYIPANLLYQLGENFLASFLPAVASSRNMGRVSATGWAMGYVGALLLLLISAGAMLLLSMQSPTAWRPLFVFAGVWFVLNMIPAWRVLREPPAAELEPGAPTLVHQAYIRVRSSIRRAGQFNQLGRFLLAFFVYGMGVQVIIAFASIIARDFGFDTVKLVIFVLQLTVTAGIAAIATARFQDRLGARPTLLIFLGVWIVSAGGLLGISLWPGGAPEAAFWVVGNGIGLGIGGIGTASRSMVGRFTPRHRTAEFFGLWGMTYKLAGVAGVWTFAEVKAGIGLPASLGVLAAFFVVGIVLLLRVNETAGLRAARRAERGAGLAPQERDGHVVPSPASDRSPGADTVSHDHDGPTNR
ncbi:MAG: MFS transporter [Planctomycetota bacterium]